MSILMLECFYDVVDVSERGLNTNGLVCLERSAPLEWVQ